MEQAETYGYTEECEKIPRTFPPQHQDRQPGLEYVMNPLPVSQRYSPRRRLENKVAVVTGGDSGIGRAVAYDFTKEGASVVIIYYNEERDAQETAKTIEEMGGKCLLLQGDLKDICFVQKCVRDTIDNFGQIDILVNNHAVQFIRHSILEISPEQLNLVFQNNIISYFYMIQCALPHMKEGASIINTASVTAYQGNALAHRSGNPCQRGCAGTDLDAADSVVLLGGGGHDIRHKDSKSADDARRSAMRDFTMLCISRFRRRVLYDRAGAPAQRGNDCRRIKYKIFLPTGTKKAYDRYREHTQGTVKNVDQGAVMAAPESGI